MRPAVFDSKAKTVWKMRATDPCLIFRITKEKLLNKILANRN
jgi:hypothetical protein